MLAVTTGEWINLVVAGVAALALIVATWQLRLAIVGLRRASQPVVVVHEVRHDFAQGEGLIQYEVYLRNHGIGTAFNVRFGIELAGARYPFTVEPDAERGARQIVEAGARVPAGAEFVIRASAAPFLAGEGQAAATRAFWARYENSFAETWETTNPHDPTANLGIERVRRRELRRRERNERERRLEVEQEAARIDEQLRADLIAMQEDAGED